MITRDELNLYVNELLACNKFDDYAPNGLQIAGSPSISTICTAVTASLEVIKKATQANADALLVHHGYFWKGEPSTIIGMRHARISELIRHNVNLYAYHLPLDCHLELGNNAQLAQLLELQAITTHQIGRNPDLLWSGCLTMSKSGDELTALLTDRLQRMPLHIPGSNKPIERIAWCSGGAQDFIDTAHSLGVDAYLSGEVSERTYYQAHELGIHYFACGHHATERYGIQALGNHLAQKFNLSHLFIDSDNPV